MSNNKERVRSTLNIIRQNLMESFDDEKERLSEIQDALNKINIQESDGLKEILKGRNEINTPSQLFYSKLVDIQNKVDLELQELIENLDN